MDVGSVSGVSGGASAQAMPESAAVGNAQEAANESAVSPIIGEDEDLISLGQSKGTSNTDDIGWRFDMGVGEESGEGKELIDQIMKIMEIMLALKLLEETMKQFNESGGISGESGGGESAAAGTDGGAGGAEGGSGAGATAGGAL